MTHLVRDPFKSAFEFVAVLTNNRDLVEPSQIVGAVRLAPLV